MGNKSFSIQQGRDSVKTEQGPPLSEDWIKGMMVVGLFVVLLIGVANIPRLSEIGKANKAKMILSGIRQAEKTYHGVYGTHVACANNEEIRRQLGSYWVEGDSSMSSDTHWNYSVVIKAPPEQEGFIVVATRAGKTKNADETITLDQDNVWGGTFTP